MRALQLITVMPEEGVFRPLGGGHLNTIRMFKGKYQGIAVGDDVIMHHTTDPETKDAVPLTELLKISSIAIGTLDNLVEAHGHLNHSGKSNDVLKAEVLAFYPPSEGAEHNPNQLFIAIYF